MQLMKKTKEYFSAKRITKTFSLIDINLAKQFIKLYLLSFIILTSGIIVSVMAKTFSFILLMSIISFYLISRTTYQIIRCTEGEIFIYEGVCVEVASQDSRKKYIILKADNEIYFTVYAFFIKKYLEGNIIRVFCPQSCITKKTDDMYIVTNPYYIHIEKSNPLHPNTNTQTDDSVNNKRKKQYFGKGRG